MRRPAYPKHTAGPPPPLAPAVRTVGQVVGESVKFYRENFWASTTLGFGPALIGVGLASLHHVAQALFFVIVGGLLLSISFVAGLVLVRDLDLRPGRTAAAVLAGWLIGSVGIALHVWLFPAFPTLVWFSVVGLAVPVVLIERHGVRSSVRRAIGLSAADLVHVVGSLLTLAFLSLIFNGVLFLLLRSEGQTVRIAASFISLLIVSPILFIGAAVLYADQVARLASGFTRAQRLEARRQHVATAPREIVAHRPGRAARPRRPKAE